MSRDASAELLRDVQCAVRAVDFVFGLGETQGERAPATLASGALYTSMGELSGLGFALV